MSRKALCFWAILPLFLAVCASKAWCVDANVLELEIIKKNAEKGAEWKTKGSVDKGEVPGFYRHWPGDWNAFWLKADGTGLLYGGQRGGGIWHIMWEYHEDGGLLVLKSVQLKRQYKVIKKDGKVWMVEGREVWRQHVSLNAPIKPPRDRAAYVSPEPAKSLQSVVGR